MKVIGPTVTVRVSRDRVGRHPFPLVSAAVLKRFEHPDEVRDMTLGRFEIVRLGGMTLFDARSGINRPLRARRLGMVFQDDLLFPHLSVAANIGKPAGNRDDHGRPSSRSAR